MQIISNLENNCHMLMDLFSFDSKTTKYIHINKYCAIIHNAWHT